MGQIARRWAEIHARVQEAAAAAGRPSGVRLVAVSKTHPAEAVAEAFEAGGRDFGESYVQEHLAKREAVAALLGPAEAQIRWHFIGRLQSNKLKKLLEAPPGRTSEGVELLHALDRASLVDAVAKAGGAPSLLQVRLGLEDSKAGFEPEEVVEAVGEALRRGVRVRGLMTIPPPCEDPAVQRAHFARLRGLLAECKARWGDAGLVELSMGMSDDFELAIEEGATLVRVGTAIFGARA